MSAWKKPSRNAWRRKVWITARARCLRSKPLASSLARSCSGVPSIQSSVSTSLAVRSQSTAGTRKSGSSLVFSAISDSAAASSRRSISIADRAAQRGDGLHQAQPARLRRHRFGAPRREREGIEIDAEALLDVGAQHLHGDRLAAGRRSTSARCTCAIDAAATAGPNDAKASPSGLPSAAVDHRLGLGRAGTAPSCPAGFRDRARARRRPRPAASPGTGRA